MDALTQQITKMVNEASSEPSKAFPYALLAVFGIQRMHIFRHLRKLCLPGAILALVYRAVRGGSDESLLLIISKCISNICSNRRSSKLLLEDICGLVVILGAIRVMNSGMIISTEDGRKSIMNEIFKMSKALPSVKSMLDKEKDKARKDIEADLKVKSRAMGPVVTTLPQKGSSHSEIISLMQSLAGKENERWLEGKITGAVSHGEKVC